MIPDKNLKLPHRTSEFSCKVSTHFYGQLSGAYRGQIANFTETLDLRPKKINKCHLSTTRSEKNEVRSIDNFFLH